MPFKPHNLRLLVIFAAITLICGALLPVSASQAHAQWPWQSAYDPVSVLASVWLVLAGVALITISGRISGSGVLSAVLLLAGCIVALLAPGEFASAMGGDRARGWSILATAIVCICGVDARNTIPDRELPPLLVAGFGGVLLLGFLVSPTPYGTLVAQMSSQVRLALQDEGDLAATLSATAVEILVIGLVSMLVFVLGGIVQKRPRDLTRTAIILGIFAVATAADSVRNAQTAGLAGALVTARGTLLWLALIALGIACIATLLSTVRSQRLPALGRWAALCGVALATLLAVYRVSTPEKPADWPLSSPSGFVSTLYEDAIVNLTRSRPHSDQREAAKRIVLALAEPLGDLRSGFEQLLPLLDDPGYHRGAIAARVRDINRLAREAAIPYFLDADITFDVVEESSPLWTLDLKAYRIQGTRSAKNDRQSFPLLWVESTQPDQSARQGFSEAKNDFGVVVLDVVRRNWNQQLAPSLVGVSRGAPFDSAYSQHSLAIRAALESVVVARAPTRWKPQALLAFERYLECLSYRILAGSNPAGGRYCRELVAKIEPLIIEALALNVERHELQHMIDDENGGARVPVAVKNTLRDRSSYEHRRIAAELSAYLSEIADGPMPHLSLANFIAVAESRPDSPEASAHDIMRWFLSRNGTLETLFSLHPNTLRDRAELAYRRLFDRAIPRVAAEPLATL